MEKYQCVEKSDRAEASIEKLYLCNANCGIFSGILCYNLRREVRNNIADVKLCTEQKFNLIDTCKELGDITKANVERYNFCIYQHGVSSDICAGLNDRTYESIKKFSDCTNKLNQLK